jgi:hypothetical protein
MYVVQLLIVGLGVFALVWRLNFVFRLQVLGWVLLNFIIFLRYGQTGQLEFYSNDQRHFVNVVETLISGSFTTEVEWWASSVRIPFTIPATVIALTGVNPALALKLISLIFLLGTTHLVLSYRGTTQRTSTFMIVYLTALGVIGVFFSSLAQRETSLMFFTTLIFVKQIPQAQATGFGMIILLRPHLAVAIAVGSLCLWVSKSLRRDVNWTPFRAALTITSGSLIGYVLFGVGLQLRDGIPGYFGHNFGIRPVTRIFSNYFGLQFLASPESTIELSIFDLFLARILLSETIIIPLFFTILVVVSRRASHQSQWILWSFSIYVGLVTNTDFNSFRQNLPLMPTMGLGLLQMMSGSQRSKSYSQSLRLRVGTSD